MTPSSQSRLGEFNEEGRRRVLRSRSESESGAQGEVLSNRIGNGRTINWLKVVAVNDPIRAIINMWSSGALG